MALAVFPTSVTFFAPHLISSSSTSSCNSIALVDMRSAETALIPSNDDAFDLLLPPPSSPSSRRLDVRSSLNFVVSFNLLVAALSMGTIMKAVKRLPPQIKAPTQRAIETPLKSLNARSSATAGGT